MLKALLKFKFCVVIKVSIFFQDKGTLVVIHLVFLLFLAFISRFPLLFLSMVLFKFYKFKIMSSLLSHDSDSAIENMNQLKLREESSQVQ